ncbi:reverse transcriptase domain-containing protein [Tanacetum coccineum]
MDAQYKELQSRAKQPTSDLDEDDIPMSREEEAKFMQTFRKTRFYNDYRDQDSNRDNWHSSGRNDYNRDNYRSNTDDKPYDLQKQFNDFTKSQLADKQSGRPSGSLPSNTQPNPQADLGDSINLMPYSLYAKLSLETLKPTKMSVRLADRSFQYPVRIAENMLVEVVKYTFPADFVILKMEEDNKVPLILGRPFLHTADVVIRVKQKQLNLGVGTERMIFNIDSAMKHSYSNDDTCFSIDVIDEILEEDFDALLDEGSKILHSIEGTLLEEEFFSKFNEFIAMAEDENSKSESDTEEPPFKKITINTDYKIKTSLEEPPTDLELKTLLDNLEVFLEEPSFLHHKIQLLDDKKPVVQKQRRLNPNMQEVVKKEIVKLLDTALFIQLLIVLRKNVTSWSKRELCLDTRVIKDFSKIARPLTKLLEKDTPFEFDDECQKAFNLLKEKLTFAPVIASPNWNLLFKLMCDASDFVVGAVLEIKDKKGTENIATDHLCRIENDESSDDSDVDDKFPGETLMEINTKDEPWFADFENYLVAEVIPKGMTY